ncbi:hypothetical protein PYW08_008840 [Mythimna loreyi]|uniref:Uncharacterized protein n=1 Tax=Mythimna loreyi TaxID=667449 RepID=A0ACC2QA80_9NEOP|nr:hypothetical protein PYW08_008840 [Mythimna loreyi]
MERRWVLVSKRLTRFLALTSALDEVIRRFRTFQKNKYTGGEVSSHNQPHNVPHCWDSDFLSRRGNSGGRSMESPQAPNSGGRSKYQYFVFNCVRLKWETT